MKPKKKTPRVNPVITKAPIEITLSPKEKLIKAISEIPIEPLNIPKGFPVPLLKYMYVKQLTDGSGEFKTDAGIILLESLQASNTRIPFTGIVYSIGPDCPEYLKVGMKVSFNRFQADSESIWVCGGVYIRLNSDYDVFGIIPHDSFVHGGVKSENQVRREKRAKQAAGYKVSLTMKDEENLDKLESKAKGTGTGKRKHYVN